MITYRKITKNDLELIKDFLYIAVHFPEGKEKPSSKELLSVPEIGRYYKYLPEHGSGFLAFDGEKGVGAAWIIEFPEHDKGYGFVAQGVSELSIAVLEDYRCKGIGTELMKKLFTLAKEMGHDTISLSVDDINKAMNLYERLGFEKVRMDGKSWVMRKKL